MNQTLEHKPISTKDRIDKIAFFILIFSIGVTSRKIMGSFVMSDFVMIAYITTNLKTLLNIQIRKFPIIMLLVLVWIICLFVSSFMNIMLINEYTFIDFILSFGRVAIYFLICLILIEKLRSRGNKETYLRMFRKALLLHISILFLSVALFYIGFNGPNILYEVYTGDIISTGYFKIFQYPLYNRYCGLFEEPSQFAQFICIYLLTDLLARKNSDSLRMNLLSILMLLGAAFYLRSVASLLIVIVPIGYYVWCYNLKDRYAIKAGIVTILVVFFLIYLPTIVTLLVELPRVQDLLSGNDKSTSVRFFSYGYPIKSLVDSGNIILGTGLGFSTDYFYYVGFKSQIIPMSILIEGGIFSLLSFLILVIYSFTKVHWFICCISVGFLMSNGYVISPMLFLLFLALVVFTNYAKDFISGSNLRFVSQNPAL